MIFENELPYISVILVTYNEQQYIENALLSLIEQTYPMDRYEILIVDGKSTDNTLSLVQNMKNKNTQIDIKIIDNPKRILAAGWNIGIKAAKGEYVVRIDAHAEAKNNFIEKNVETIIRVPEAVCVGGKLITKSMTGGNEAVSKVLSSPFGVGNSSFRVSDKEGFADTAVYGLYRKEIFKEVGYFDEFFVRNQDIELHSRIRAAGGKFYFNPDIECIYYSRNTVKKMVKQALGNGKWNMILIRTHKAALSIRHLVPFVFVVFLVFSTIGGIFYKKIWLLEALIVLTHLLLGVIASIKKTKKITEIITMPMIFFALHISYGIGYFSGLRTTLKGENKNV